MKKKIEKCRCAAVLCAVLILSIVLTACGSGVTGAMATKLVQGNLDEIYLGKYDPTYLKMVDSTESDAEDVYIGGLETEAEVFAYYFDIEYMTDDIKQEIVDLYKDIYAKASYTVNDATELDNNTFAVKVQVQPLDIFELVTDNFDSSVAVSSFYEKYSGIDTTAMTDEEYQAYDAEWAEMIIGLCREKLSDMGYMDEKSVVIQVEKNSDEIWTMSNDDFNNLDEVIIYYP